MRNHVRSHHGRLLVWALTGISVLMAPGCRENDGGNAIGRVLLALQLPTGTLLDQLSLTVTDSGGTSVLTRTLDVSHETSSIQTQLGLPAATGYSLGLSGTAADGTSCEGSSPFDIVAGQVTMVSITLQCFSNGGAPLGAVQVTTSVPSAVIECPTIASYTVHPLAADVGGAAIQLTGTASSGTPAMSWTASSGMLASASSADTTFTCTEAGAVTLTLTLTQGSSCSHSESLTVTCNAAAPDGGMTDSGMADGGMADGGAAARSVYSAGHGDLAMEYDANTNALSASIHLEGATLDGMVSNAILGVGEVEILTTATFTRPSMDSGFFANLCVNEGSTVHWLPQGNSNAATCGVPFMGLAVEVPAGTFTGDQLSLQLLSVSSPSGQGHYAIWKDGFPPVFGAASCDGIAAGDALTLSIGHDHFNMGFSEVGTWSVDYRVSGTLVSDNTTVSHDFSLQYVTQEVTPACGN
ncbi:MAG: hypothetical protein MJD61_13090 [Proteobacteria bacterium]|nr:hypothetical protein [Pseudomonadota bacterium]